MFQPGGLESWGGRICYALGSGCNNNNNIYYIGIIDNNNNYTLQTDYWLRITLQTLSCPYLGKTPKMGVSNGMEASGSQEMSQSRGLKMMNNTMKLLCQLIELRTVWFVTSFAFVYCLLYCQMPCYIFVIWVSLLPHSPLEIVSPSSFSFKYPWHCCIWAFQD